VVVGPTYGHRAVRSARLAKPGTRLIRGATMADHALPRPVRSEPAPTPLRSLSLTRSYRDLADRNTAATGRRLPAPPGHDEDVPLS
jgi:hypothetical protein